ncbi:hypothetical protein Q9R19_13890 [Microbacterium sp. ARD32]|uniref:hypothetical protein n=1 Tax=Microbacterium sp. ARD32 TaxID=2962577 RepID=UPI002881570B|nr:hypothetical protein [Microbacterium sp. ARD32]MDT0158716.1 hypothetical protein [Microbacterium sp. ARD32]
MMRHRPVVTVAVAGAMLLLSACSTAVSPSRTPASPDGGAPSPESTALSGEDIRAHIADAEWSFAPDGLLEPFTVEFHEGTATDDSGRTYEIGTGVEGDADGDGVVDLAVPVSQHDGNGLLELWYIWLGAGDDTVATQVLYPIARTTRCGDAVHSVAAADPGFRIEQTLWMPHTDEDRDCADGGTGAQVRDVSVDVIDGVAYPIQTVPIAAWGGVCPRSDWLDGILDDTVEGRAAPAAAAPTVFEAGEEVAVYELPSATLLTRDGVKFFGFQTADPTAKSGATDATAVMMHCAFAG